MCILQFRPESLQAERSRAPVAGTRCAADYGMTVFFRRFIGALVLDASAYEDVEADRLADLQSMLVVVFVCLSGGMAAVGLGLVGVGGFVMGAVLTLGGWLVWVSMIASIGTRTLAEPQTHSNVHELLRVLGYAAAPGVFIAFAYIRPAAPFVFALVAVWMIAAAVLGVRQALDYRSTGRAIGVCLVAWALSFGLLAIVSLVFTKPVS
jgi:hypothetical protein